MSLNIKEMIYHKEGKIFFAPYFKEYDITEYILEITKEMKNQKED